MLKHLSAFCLGTLFTVLTGCSSTNDFSFVYKQDIQQGNMIEQKSVNKLKLGMSKRQVRFVLGTPLLIDIFHEERWDYTYSMQRSRQPTVRKTLSLYFEDGRLARIEGDLQPDPTAPEIDENLELVVSVPDYIDNRGVITKLLYHFGLELED